MLRKLFLIVVVVSVFMGCATAPVPEKQAVQEEPVFLGNINSTVYFFNNEFDEWKKLKKVQPFYGL